MHSPLQPCPGIVVIGASRGGLEAVLDLIHALPTTIPAAIAVVLHTHAKSPKLLAFIVGSQTALPVSYADQDLPIQSGHIYLAPPNVHLLIDPSQRFALDKGPKLWFTRPAADRLFESAAAVFGSRVIGVVLTGGDGDGAAGLRAIKAAGGVALTQDPAEARDSGMPSNALRNDHPDYCVRLQEMGPLLERLTNSWAATKRRSIAISSPHRD